MKSKYTALLSFLGIVIFVLTGCGPKYTIEEHDGISIIHNKGGQRLGYAPGSGTYNGLPFEESSAAASDLSDSQKKFLIEDHLRHVLITSVESPKVAAEWNNNAQQMVEGLELGIPANTSSDPRHRSSAEMEYNAGSGGNISMWSASLGIAASFDPGLMKQFGEMQPV